MSITSPSVNMLAYVFWHWKQATISANDYETRQRDFHAALASAPPSGFLGSFSDALAPVAWTPKDQGNEVYEDWYMVENFAALGSLNEGAVTASRAVSHNAAANVVAGGTSGVYGLKIGTLNRRPQRAHWFGKPAGMSYGDMFDRLTPIVQRSGGALWMRQMVLGPAMEFCLHAAAAVAFPAEFDPLIVPLRPVWIESSK